jgi:hypothetical protein
MASQLEHLKAWVGEWQTEATHPMLPDTVVPGGETTRGFASASPAGSVTTATHSAVPLS